jgi:inner membrane protein
MASSHRAISLCLVAAIALTDRAVQQQQLGFVPRALMDEPCHLATALVVLGAITRWRGRPPGPWFVWAMLSASVLIDVDHLPLEFGSNVLTAGTPRPYTHALWLVAALGAAAAVAERRSRAGGTARAAMVSGITAGAAWGLAAHFLRDVATAPIALWWPVSSTGVQVPQLWYVVMLLALALGPPPRRGERSRRGRPGSGMAGTDAGDVTGPVRVALADGER